MNGKLILLLSMFGLAMAFATVWVIPSKIEPLVWLAIFVFCAIVIAKKAPEKPFLHGLCTSLVNSVWITSAHVLFFDTYIAHHPEEAAMSAKMPLPPRLMMVVMGPLFGLGFGLILGLFSVIASKFVKPAAA